MRGQTMAYSKPIENPRAAKMHEDALASHERAWNEMHEIGRTLGHDSPEYADARRAVVLLRGDITRAREKAETARTWSR
jgi:hypothetical protein